MASNAPRQGGDNQHNATMRTRNIEHLQSIRVERCRRLFRGAELPAGRPRRVANGPLIAPSPVQILR